VAGRNHRGGRDGSMSMVPMGGNKISPNPWPWTITRRVHQHGTRDGKYRAEFGITREAADAFAATSHKKAVAAIAAGAFKDETVAVEVKNTSVPMNGNGNQKGKPVKPTTQLFLSQPMNFHVPTLRSKCSPHSNQHFTSKDQFTAGNSSPMSDGAAATVIMSDARAKALGLKPLGRFVAYATADARRKSSASGRCLRFRKR